MSNTRGPRERALDEAIEQACAALASQDRERCWAALVALELSVGRDFNALGNAVEYALPRDLFDAPDAFFRDLAARTLPARTLALPLLAAVDPAAAVPVFQKLIGGDLGFYAMSYEAGVVRAVGAVWPALAPLLPAGVLSELFLAGRAAAHGLADADLAAVPLDGLVESVVNDRLGYVHVDVPRRFLAVHPALATNAQRLAFLDDLVARTAQRTSAVRAFDGALVAALADAGCADAVPTIARLWNAALGEHLEATAALLAFGHRPSIEAMMARLPAALAAADLRWDPHHVTLALQTPLRATFAWDPATATDRFAAFFTPEALETERGAKFAHDVLSVGLGVAVHHGATVLGTGDRAWLDADPRWFDVAERLASHPRLKRMAATVRERRPRTGRKAKARPDA